MLYVVTGPPASGKTTWVREHAKPGDVVVDYDLIAGALSGPGSATTHDHRGALRLVTFRARSAAIREAMRHIDSVDVYVIHSMPPADALARYTEHNAQIVAIDPGRDIVMARIAEQRPTASRAVAERWYSQAGRGQRGTPPVQHASPPKASRAW